MRSKRFILGLTLALACGLALPLGAQAGEYGGGGYFTPTIIRLDLSSLNAELAKYNYPKLGDTVTALGGGGYALIDRLLIGGEGGGFTATAANNQYSTSLEGGYGLFRVGYVVHSTERFRLYPSVGLGGGGATLRLRDLNRTAPALDNALNQPTEVAYSTGSWLIDLGVGADYLLGGSACSTVQQSEAKDAQAEDENGSSGCGGWVVGLRLGYLRSLGQKQWEMGGKPAPSLPSFGIDGPYIRLTIGGGGWVRSE
ncbi:MAG TPA: hypothetical protein GXX28_10815 [Firmicutes bacterium]|nr:hypothetical protein [Bacillota bacterium]